MTVRDYRLGGKVMSRVTAQGLDAGGVYTIEAVRQQRTIAGPVTTVTVQVGQRCVDVQNPAEVFQPAHIEAYGVRGLQSRPWRRTFATAEQLTAWCDQHDAAVRGQRFVEGG